MTPYYEDDWKRIAHELAAALESFTAYDGYGRGGAEDCNAGDWKAADQALNSYYTATNRVGK